MDLMILIAAALRKEGIEVHPSPQAKALHVVHDGEVYKILAVKDARFRDRLERYESLRHGDPAAYEAMRREHPERFLTQELIVTKHPEMF